MQIFLLWFFNPLQIKWMVFQHAAIFVVVFQSIADGLLDFNPLQLLLWISSISENQ
jgi:hypothetical protein